MEGQGPPKSIIVRSAEVNPLDASPSASTVGHPPVAIPLTFSPQPNFRSMSYIAFAVAFAGSIFAGMFGDATGQYLLSEVLSAVLCCGGLISGLFLDAAFYKTKADWQKAHGLPSSWSTFSMVVERLTGVALVVVFLFVFVDLLYFVM